MRKAKHQSQKPHAQVTNGFKRFFYDSFSPAARVTSPSVDRANSRARSRRGKWVGVFRFWVRGFSPANRERARSRQVAGKGNLRLRSLGRVKTKLTRVGWFDFGPREPVLCWTGGRCW